MAARVKPLSKTPLPKRPVGTYMPLPGADPLIHGRCAGCRTRRLRDDELWYTVKEWDDWLTKSVAFCSTACLIQWAQQRPVRSPTTHSPTPMAATGNAT